MGLPAPKQANHDLPNRRPTDVHAIDTGTSRVCCTPRKRFFERFAARLRTAPRQQTTASETNRMTTIDLNTRLRPIPTLDRSDTHNFTIDGGIHSVFQSARARSERISFSCEKEWVLAVKPIPCVRQSPVCLTMVLFQNAPARARRFIAGKSQ